MKWDSQDFVPTVHQFDNTNSGIQNEKLLNESREVEYFLNFISEELANVIGEETNIHAQQQKAKNWINIDVHEFYVFIAITMRMPHVKKYDQKDYFCEIRYIFAEINGCSLLHLLKCLLSINELIEPPARTSD